MENSISLGSFITSGPSSSCAMSSLCDFATVSFEVCRTLDHARRNNDAIPVTLQSIQDTDQPTDGALCGIPASTRSLAIAVTTTEHCNPNHSYPKSKKRKHSPSATARCQLHQKMNSAKHSTRSTDIHTRTATSRKASYLVPFALPSLAIQSKPNFFTPS